MNQQMRVRLFKYHYYNRYKAIAFSEERGNRFNFLEKLKIYINISNRIELPFVDLDVNTVCDLRCAKCAKCTPYFKKKIKYPAEKIISDLNLLLKYVDCIYAMSIIGGEPFLNQDIDKVITYCSSCQKIKDIDITTNATIIPSERVFQALAKSRVVVHISDYRYIDHRLLETRTRFIQKLEEYHIPYQYFEHEFWLDFGKVKKRKYTLLDKKRMFYQCPMNSCSIYHNRILYRCGRASFLRNHDIINNENEIIALETIKSRREMQVAIRKFFSLSYLDSCEYCSNHPRSVTPGIQLPNNTD